MTGPSSRDPILPGQETGQPEETARRRRDGLLGSRENLGLSAVQAVTPSPSISPDRTRGASQASTYSKFESMLCTQQWRFALQ